jgi:hypothetical protein
LPASLYANGNAPADSKAHHATAARQNGAVADYPISLSNDGIDLQKRVDSVGNRTVDYAQNLLGSFAQQLFGDAGKGATISFDSASLDVSSSYAEGVQHTEGAGGVTDAAALQLNDSSHFLGKGTITTADGRKFDFEVEIQYNYQLQASASQTQGTGASQGQDPATPAIPDATGDAASSDKPASASNNSLPTVVFPNVDFPGTLADLFKLIGHDLHGTLSTPGNDKSQGNSIDRNTLRSLSLRLLSLIDHKNTDTYSGAKAKSVANAYGSTANAAKPAANDAAADTGAAAAATPAAVPAAASAETPSAAGTDASAA